MSVMNHVMEKKIEPHTKRTIRRRNARAACSWLRAAGV
jgi:hypothetical protein